MACIGQSIGASVFAPADYRRGSDLFKRTCLLLDRMLADIRVQEEVWRVGWG